MPARAAARGRRRRPRAPRRRAGHRAAPRASRRPRVRRRLEQRRGLADAVALRSRAAATRRGRRPPRRSGAGRPASASAAGRRSVAPTCEACRSPTPCGERRPRCSALRRTQVAGSMPQPRGPALRLAACPRATRCTAPPAGSSRSSASGSRPSRRIRAAAVHRGRGARGRLAARGGRGRRQEPAAALRGRRRAAQPSAHARALARRPRGSPVLGPAVARPAGRASSRQCRWNGPVLELRPAARSGGSAPTSSTGRPTSTRWSPGSGRSSRRARLGEALLDQRLVSGIGNMWKAEALWRARVSPWRPLGDVADDELRDALDAGAPG